MKKILLIIIAVFVLAVSAVGCSTTTPTATPVPTNQQVSQPTYTPYPTLTSYPTLTPYPTQVLPTLYPTQVPTPVPYRPSGSSVDIVLLGYGFQDSSGGNYIWNAPSGDGMYIAFTNISDGGFVMNIQLKGYNTGKYNTLISEIIRDLMNGGKIPYDAANWIYANMPNAKDKPTTELNRLALEESIALNNKGIEYIRITAVLIK
jgi:hypothetical protein